MVSSRSFKAIANLEEKWYGTKYKLEDIDKTIIKKWENCGVNDELQFPKPNPFVPENFEILPLDNETSKNPVIVSSAEMVRMWHKQDKELALLPTAWIKFMIYSPLANLDPLSNALTYMFCSMLQVTLQEYSSDAFLAGIAWGIAINEYGFQLDVAGYNDKLNVLFEKIIEKMTTFTVNEKMFEIAKEAKVRELKSFENMLPIKQAGHYMKYLIAARFWSNGDLLAVQDKVTPQALTTFVPLLLSRLYIEGLAYGNINEEGAAAYARSLQGKLSAKSLITPLKPQQLFRSRLLQLNDGSNFLYEVRNKIHKSSSIGTYLQCGLTNTTSSVELDLLYQIIKQPSFDILRTKEQLGYMVETKIDRKNGVQGLSIWIQSDRHPKYLIQRIEAFLVYARDLLVNLTNGEFESYRNTVANKQDVSDWNEIVSQEYHFDRDVEKAYLGTITKKQVLDFFDRHIAHQAPNRRQLSVYVVSDAEGGAGTFNGTTVLETPQGLPKPPILKQTLIEDVTSFKKSQGLWPLPKSYIDF